MSRVFWSVTVAVLFCAAAVFFFKKPETVIVNNPIPATIFPVSTNPPPVIPTRRITPAKIETSVPKPVVKESKKEDQTTDIQRYADVKAMVYQSGMTLQRFLKSDEYRALPESEREQLLIEVTRMVNTGLLDAKQFMGGLPASVNPTVSSDAKPFNNPGTWLKTHPEDQ